MARVARARVAMGTVARGDVMVTSVKAIGACRVVCRRQPSRAVAAAVAMLEVEGSSRTPSARGDPPTLAVAPTALGYTDDDDDDTHGGILLTRPDPNVTSVAECPTRLGSSRGFEPSPPRPPRPSRSSVWLAVVNARGVGVLGEGRGGGLVAGIF
ncbi:unnamed protein product [Lampetra planeri]